MLSYGTAQAIYRLWFHPLSKFPGPLHLSLSSFPAYYSNYVKGNWVRHVVGLHQKYGPAVRIGPNHISLDGSIGWPEVYGRQPAGRAEFQKQAPFFPDQHEAFIFASRDRHRRQRRQLGHAFSDAALTQQEPVISKYVDLLLDRLSQLADEGQAINIVQWLNFTTFDIIGDLVFSSSFSCLEKNGYHPWVLSICRGVRAAFFMRFSRHYPIIARLIDMLRREPLAAKLIQIRSGAKDKARARLEHGPEPIGQHHDIMAYMMKKTRDGGQGLSESEALANAPSLVIAGSETTATALSGFCFYMTRNPQAHAFLANEVRTAFTSENDISLTSTSSLEYLQACISETLRMYPPAAETGVRVSPGALVDGKFVPAGVSSPFTSKRDDAADLFSFAAPTGFSFRVSMGHIPKSSKLRRARVVYSGKMAASHTPSIRGTFYSRQPGRLQAIQLWSPRLHRQEFGLFRDEADHLPPSLPLRF